MDLLQLIRRQIEQLPPEYNKEGVQSVFQHIEAAIRHLERGKRERDDTAFTDAIYRTNQAFEGGIEEAYLVLAQKSSEHVNLVTMESYLDSHSVFRDRVLDQFRTYRKHWRNEAAHNHNLDFDEKEAFLAIVNVAAFTKLLIDQISSRLVSSTFERSINTRENFDDSTLVWRTARSLYVLLNGGHLQDDLWEFAGKPIADAAAGFLSGSLRTERIALEERLTSGSIDRADMIVQSDSEKVVVEFKKLGTLRPGDESQLQRMQRAIEISNASAGVLVFYTEDFERYLIEFPEADIAKSILIVRPRTFSDMPSN